MAKKKKELKQQTLEATMGRSRVRRTVVSKPKKAKANATAKASPDMTAQRSSPRNHNAPPSSAPSAFSSMQTRSSPLVPKKKPPTTIVLDSSSEESEAEPEPRKKKGKTIQIESDEDHEDEDEDDVFRPSSSAVNRRRRSPIKKQVVLSEESESELEPSEKVKEEEESEEDEFPVLPPPTNNILGKRSRVKREDSSDDDDLIVASPRKKVTRASIAVKGVPGDDSDEDDKPIVTPVSARNRLKKNIVLDDSDEDDEPQQLSSPTKRRRLVRRGGGLGDINEEDDNNMGPALRSSQAATRRKPRTEKEKALELLRRKRAGEVINEEDLEEDSDEEEEVPKKALYDSDSDLVALHEFEDDEEGVMDISQAVRDGKKRSKKQRKKQISSDSSDAEDNSDDDRGGVRGGDGGGGSGSDQEGSEDDWLVDDGEIGVPDDLMTQIPLEFTKHSHKPLKEHFRDVIEWCVQVKINPGFAEKQHEIYRLGWQKLDDEVRALAQSKFASSSWKNDFYMALRARPYFTNVDIGGTENAFGLEDCAACGRRGHTAKWRMSFSGPAYYKSFTSQSFLEPVESRADYSSSSPASSSSSSSSSSSFSSDSEDSPKKDSKEGEEEEEYQEVDEDGNPIPPTTKSWLIGSVCNSNAETAHSLLHWKYALMDWVDSNLKTDGYMAPKKLAKRMDWKPKKKYKLVDKILKKWVEDGTVRRLWREFKDTIEKARNKSTTGGRVYGAR